MLEIACFEITSAEIALQSMADRIEFCADISRGGTTPDFYEFLHLKKKPEARIKTGSLADVRAISGYVMSKSGKMYAVTSFINHPNAWRGLEAHDQLLAWLLDDGPEPKHAR